MMSIGKLAGGPGAGRYYIDQVAQGREDYYAGEGEATGVWIGTGAASLGLTGEVDEEGLARLLEGRDPISRLLLRPARSSSPVAGFDLTFRAPKSVSVLFGVAEPDFAQRIIRAHEEAVAQAIGYLESEACWTRRGRAGAIRLPGRGFVAAAFRHRSSRAGDPLLHTHVVVANATQAADGRWTALDGRELYRHAKTAGYLYQAALRAELSRNIWLRWQAVERGTADVEGVPRRVIEHFSQRRAEILELMAARGETSARAAQVATLETRRRKDYGVPVDRLRAEWRARAAEHGLDRVALRRVMRRRPERRLAPGDLAKRLEGQDGLTRDRSTFTRRDVLQAFAEHARDGETVASIESSADGFLARDGIVELEPVAGERRYSTCELLQIERCAIERAQRPRPTAAVVAESALRTALACRPSITAEQRALVIALTRSERGVDPVRAPAGTGKTFALDAAREAWQASGVAVLGCALAAKAAGELRDQAAIDTTTIARLTYALDSGVRLARGTVLVVDEAGMVGTRDLARLLDAAEEAQAKLVLVGDDRQLPEIQAGGLFSALADRLGAIELTQVHRQREAWDRDALRALRDGDVERFARAYHEHGQIVAAPTADAARAALVDDWWAATERGDRALMIAHRRSDVADLNRRARERMRAAGRLGVDALVTRERAFAVGDRVVTTRNDRRLGVVNGQSGTLSRIGHGTLSLELDRGVRIDLPESYARDGRLDHGYATTAHRAQGATVDRAFVLGSDELYREWGYTALSRHREEARFYVTAMPTFLNEAPEPLRDADVPRRVGRMLEESRAEHLALHGASPDHLRGLMLEQIEHITTNLADVDAALHILEERRARTRWYESRRRGGIDRAIADHRTVREQWQDRVDGLTVELAERPEPREPTLWRGRDPLARLDPATGLGRERSPQRGLTRDDDLGMDLSR
jgi:conjugative relaxase-like TrwC/TraI family protein